MRYALISMETYNVLNVIEAAENYQTPEEGLLAIPSDTADIGDLYDENGEFTKPS